jgi:hypothetical protein
MDMRLPLDITEGGGGMTGHRSPLLLTARITMKFTSAAHAAWDCISSGATSGRKQAARGPSGQRPGEDRFVDYVAVSPYFYCSTVM